MEISKFIQSAVAGDALQAKETLNDILSSRAFESIDGRKKELSQTLFGGEPKEVEVQDTADSEVEEDELLTQEEFNELSDEDQELYLEALNQLDEIGDTPAGKTMLGKYVKKRVKQLPKVEVGYQMAPDDSDARMIKKYQSKVNKGIGRAVDRLTK
jgi:hypothetical protein